MCEVFSIQLCGMEVQQMSLWQLLGFYTGKL